MGRAVVSSHCYQLGVDCSSTLIQFFPRPLKPVVPISCNSDQPGFTSLNWSENIEKLASNPYLKRLGVRAYV